MATTLKDNGFPSVESVAGSNVAALCAVPGLGPATAARILKSATMLAEPVASKVEAKKAKAPSTGKKPKPKAKVSDTEKTKKGKKKKKSKKEKKEKKSKKGKKGSKKTDKKKSGKKGKKKKGK